MPEFYGSRILQDIFHIFNNLFCSTLCKVVPFQTDSVFLVGIVLNILKEMQISIHAPVKGATAKITKTIPNDFYKINNYNNSFA